MVQSSTASEAPTAPGRGAVQLLVARLVFLGSGFLISIILARNLGPADFGVYGVIMSLLSWIQIVQAGGIPGATAKMIHQHPGEIPLVEQSARILLLTWGLALFAACWFLAPLLARWFDMPSGVTLFRFATLDIPLASLYLGYQGILNGHRLFFPVSLSLIIHTLSKLLGITVLLAVGLSVVGALIAHVAATLIVLAYLVTRYPLSFGVPSRTLARSMLSMSLPMAGYLVALQVLLGVGLWLLKGMESDGGEAVGYYVAALNVTRVFTVIPSVMAPVLFTSLAWALARSDERKVRDLLHGAMRFGLVLLVPGCTLLMVNADAVMALLYSDVYRQGGEILRYQAAAFAFSALLDILFNAQMAAGAFTQSAAVVVGLIPVMLILTVIMIGKAGGAGVALALMAVTGAGLAVGLFMTYRRFGTLAQGSTVIKVFAASAVIGIIAHYVVIEGIWLLPKFAVLLGSYLVMLVLMGEITLEDAEHFAVWRR